MFIQQTLPKIKNYALLIRLHRPIPIFLLLWPTLCALWIATHGHPDLKTLFIFIMGVFMMRSAGCIINDFADRHFDGAVERTKHRPLAKALVSIQEALFLFAGFCLVGFLLVLQLNWLCIQLSFLAVALVVIYPYTKRFLSVPQLILGLAYSSGVLFAFAATTNTLPFEAWLLYLITVLWTIAYDTMYAMVDRVDDLKIGIKSSAIFFGDKDKFAIALLQISILVLWILLSIVINCKPIFYIVLGFASITFIYQQSLIRQREPQKCLQAFSNNHWFGLLIFLGLIMNYANL